ncbi:MAG: capsule assembly Wzi family protein [Lachnoclostridium sp.]|nr:capsule assembly Wzi family protein [Lachnoclostridium sp.]
MRLSITALALAMLMSAAEVRADYPVDFSASLTAGGGQGSFAPYYISSLRGGRFSGQYNAQVTGMLSREIDKSQRFSYGFGLELAAGYGSSIDYERYDAVSATWHTHAVKPSRFFIQQLYGEVKYRGVFLSAGMKERGSALLNQRLTSGDLIESGNARPIPQVRVGFIDFQDVPFTQGWLQIQGEIGYGKFTDNGWTRDQYNYYLSHLSTGEWYNYKRCYFRVAPRERFSVTLGMQAAGEFGGNVDWYERGRLFRSQHRDVKLNTFFKMFLPTEDGSDGYYTGNHLGSWDLQARYRLKSAGEIKAYFSWPWEDGSGIGKLNGWDGLWGVEYDACRHGVVRGVVVEYLDLTNQSGPIHYASADYEGTTLKAESTGADDYYNNTSFGPWANYGFAIGSPAVMSPLYNTDGFPDFLCNRVRGIHLGLEGDILPCLSYRMKAGYRKAWGNGKLTLQHTRHLTSVMLEADWKIRRIKGLSLLAQAEIDRGNLPCNSAGVMVTLKYEGLLNFKK